MNNFNLPFIILFLLMPFTAFTNNAKIDSVKTKSVKIKNDSVNNAKTDKLKTDTISAVTNDTTEQGYKLDQPGTITFTVGSKIKGKVDKPQVMIFLPKEKTTYMEVELNRSFKNEIMEPLPFVPLTK